MPQLDPTPWFLILFTSWFIFLMYSPMKISKYNNLNDPSHKTHKGLSKSWLWPWA